MFYWFAANHRNVDFVEWIVECEAGWCIVLPTRPAPLPRLPSWSKNCMPYITVVVVLQESEWSVLQCVLEQLPSVLRNKTIVSAASPRDVEKISARLCKLVIQHV